MRDEGRFPATVPLADILATVVAALIVGALAGAYPAVRASRLAPTEALRST